MSIYSTIIDLWRAVSTDDGGTDQIRVTDSSTHTLLANSFISGQIEAPVNKTYTLDLYSIDARTIQSLAIKTSSGTCTAAIKIDGTAVTGISAVSVTSTETVATATALNTVAIGQTITLDISSVSNPLDLVFTLKYTRTS